MRLLLLVISCLPLLGCGLVHRSANIARAVYSENHDPLLVDVEYLTAFAPKSSDPVIVVESVAEKPPEGVAAELSKIKPADGQSDPALYLPNGEFFNPLCLLNNIGTLETPVHPTIGCGRDNIHTLTETPQLSQDKTYIYIQYTLDEPKIEDEQPSDDEDETDEDAAENAEPQSKINEIRYSNIGTIQGQFALNTINTLATGEIITILGLYDFSIDSENKDTLERRKAFVEGDRCNSGLLEYNIDANNELHFSINHTPRSLLSIPYLNDEQQQLTMDPVLESYLSCPACCIGTNDFIEDISSGFSISAAYIDYILKLQATTPPLVEGQREKPQACFDRILLAVYQSGIKVMTDNELTSFLKGIEKNCFPGHDKIVVDPNDPNAEEPEDREQ